MPWARSTLFWIRQRLNRARGREWDVAVTRSMTSLCPSPAPVTGFITPHGLEEPMPSLYLLLPIPPLLLVLTRLLLRYNYRSFTFNPVTHDKVSSPVTLPTRYMIVTLSHARTQTQTGELDNICDSIDESNQFYIIDSGISQHPLNNRASQCQPGRVWLFIMRENQ